MMSIQTAFISLPASVAVESSAEPEIKSRPWPWTERVLWGCLCLVNLVPFWVPAKFPSQNGPWFLLPAHMFKEYHNPAFDYATYYVQNWHPIPHLLHDLLVALTSYVAPVYVAEKIGISLYAVLLPVSVFYFLAALAPGRRWPAYLSFLLVHSYLVMRGYHDFTLSIPLYFIALAYWYPRRARLRPRDCLVLGLLSALTCLSHLMTFALLAGSIGWLHLMESKNWGRATWSSLSSTWPGWLLTLDYLLFTRKANWFDKKDTTWNSFGTNLCYIVEEYFYSVSVVAAAFAVAGFLWGGLWCWNQWCRSSPASRPALSAVLRQPLTTLCLFFGVCYFIVPYHVIGWHKANSRLIPIVLVLSLAVAARLIPPVITRAGRLALLAPVTAAVVGSVAFLTPEILRMDALVEVYVSGMEQVDQNPRLLAIHLDNPRFGRIRPMTRAHDHYHIAKGGASHSCLAALNTLTVMMFRHYPVSDILPAYDRTLDDETLQEQVFSRYNHILVWGRDERLERLLGQSPFQRVHHRGELQIYRLRQ